MLTLYHPRVPFAALTFLLGKSGSLRKQVNVVHQGLVGASENGFDVVGAVASLLGHPPLMPTDLDR
ncbi:MAG TPA: hypothetical protein VFQ06_01485 [Nitrospira sp.]|nr:hypothetical protein [Nitrospira sp.]